MSNPETTEAERLFYERFSPDVTLQPSNHLVWLVCPYMLGRDELPCQKCPRWEMHPKYGTTVRGCRMAAEEVVNIVQTGNPWRKPAAEVAGTKWEAPT